MGARRAAVDQAPAKDIRLTNPLERLIGEVKRRSHVVRIFPNEAAIKGYDSKANRAACSRRGIVPVIPYKSSAKNRPNSFPKALYRARARMRADRRQAQVLQAHRPAPREDQGKLPVLRRNRRQLHLDQICPHDLEHEAKGLITAGDVTAWGLGWASFLAGSPLAGPAFSVSATVRLSGSTPSALVLRGCCIVTLAPVLIPISQANFHPTSWARYCEPYLTVRSQAQRLARPSTADARPSCELSLCCPSGPGRGCWSCDASVILGGSDEHP